MSRYRDTATLVGLALNVAGALLLFWFARLRFRALPRARKAQVVLAMREDMRTIAKWTGLSVEELRELLVEHYQQEDA